MFGVSDIYCRGLKPKTRLESFVLGFKGFITALRSGLGGMEGNITTTLRDKSGAGK